MSTDPLHPWRARRERRRWWLWLVLLLALLAHVAILGLVVLISLLHLGDGPERKPAPHAVNLRTIPAEQWDRNRTPSADRRADRSQDARSHQSPPKPEEKKKTPMPKGQVVDVAPGNDQQAPDAKYLAEHDNKVQKESRSREQTPFYRNAMPQRTTNAPTRDTGRDQVEKAQIAGNNGMGNDDRPLREAGKSQKQAFEIPDQKRRSEIAMKTDSQLGPGAQVQNRSEAPEVHGNSRRLKVTPGEPGGGEEEASSGKQGTPGVANLLPSASILDKITGAAPNDHLSDVDEGQGTFLNTKEWRFASFFNRVKQGVGMHWNPSTPLRQRDPSGNIYGGKDRYTILNVALNERGMVKEIYVEKSCGVDFLDAEAIKSFERAQPFPNPPPGLMGGDQAIHFSFGFFLEMGAGARLRLFRQGG